MSDDWHVRYHCECCGGTVELERAMGEACPWCGRAGMWASVRHIIPGGVLEISREEPWQCRANNEANTKASDRANDGADNREELRQCRADNEANMAVGGRGAGSGGRGVGQTENKK